jgi:hypothetical protein
MEDGEGGTKAERGWASGGHPGVRRTGLDFVCVIVNFFV